MKDYRTPTRSIKMDGKPKPPAGSKPMPPTTDEIEDVVLSLPRADRERISRALNASLDSDPEIEEAWNNEIRRRVADMKAGRAEMIEGDEFDRELDKLLI